MFQFIQHLGLDTTADLGFLTYSDIIFVFGFQTTVDENFSRFHR